MWLHSHEIWLYIGLNERHSCPLFRFFLYIQHCLHFDLDCIIILLLILLFWALIYCRYFVIKWVFRVLEIILTYCILLLSLCCVWVLMNAFTVLVFFFCLFLYWLSWFLLLFLIMYSTTNLLIVYGLVLYKSYYSHCSFLFSCQFQRCEPPVYIKEAWMVKQEWVVNSELSIVSCR